jgi:hypothetical protein
MRTKLAIGVFLLSALVPASAEADCKCLANGRVFHHGEIACLHLPSGAQLAQCGMVLNNSSWIKLRDGCPIAQAGEIQFKVAETAPHPYPLPMKLAQSQISIESLCVKRF